MSENNEEISITMLRDDMENLPSHTLPDGYSLRPYRPGDEKVWMGIWVRAESPRTLADDLFQNQFGHDLPAMPERCRFLVAPNGTAIGTSTAWRQEVDGEEWGQVHWVGIVPEYQGRGLAKPMLAETMRQLRSLGHNKARLGTATHRLTAIKVYLDFGFRPDLKPDKATQHWQQVKKDLPHPTLDAIKELSS